jgi:cytochrome c551/c552
MRKFLNAVIPIIPILALVLQSPDIKAEDGRTVFESLRCGICHKADEGKSNPSLAEISKAYNRDEARLTVYFRGEAEPVVNKEKSGLMKRYIEKTKALSREDLKSLVGYVLGSGTKNKSTRENLQIMADAYIQALKKGDPAAMPLASEAKYIENRKDTSFEEGIWKEPLAVDFHRSFFDEELSETFTEVICASGSHPCVIGTRLKINGDRIAEVEALVTDEDDWLFNASTYLKYSPQESWDILPAEMRSDRRTLIRAANAYFDIFKDPAFVDKIQWNIPCARLEGGIYSNPENKPDALCTGGPPLEGSVEITNRRFIVDVEMGSVIGLANFGDENGWPDSHIFRLENGRMRYIHTLTVCPDGCEFPSSKEQ